MRRADKCFAAALFAALIAVATDAAAQPAKWPLRQVRITVPYSAGSGSDLTSRIIAEKLAARWGQPVIVDNRPGGAAILGMQEFMKGSRDGHDLLMGSNGELAVNPHVYAKLGYDVERDFEPVVPVFRVPFVFFVSAASDIKSLRELVAAARAAPGKLSFASSGSGSTMHLGMEMFNMHSGLQMLHVPFKGAAQLMPTVASGEVTSMLLTYNTARSLVELGRLRPLAVAAETRLHRRPDIPTAAEAGIPFSFAPWGVLITLKGVSSPLADRLNADINDVLTLPDVRERYEGIGFEITGGSRADAAELIRGELARMREVVQRTGIKPGQ